jgi:hypothetical protein
MNIFEFAFWDAVENFSKADVHECPRVRHGAGNLKETEKSQPMQSFGLIVKNAGEYIRSQVHVSALLHGGAKG